MAEFDKFAENYSDIHKKAVSLSGEDDLFFVELKIKLLKEYFKKRSMKKISILDYGCGTGRSAQFISKYFPNASFLGVDPSEKSISVAKQKYPDYDFSVLDGKLSKKRFDIVFSSCVFHHIPVKKRLKSLNFIHGLLKEKGYFVMFEHNPYNPLTLKVVKDCPFDKGVVLLKPDYSRRLFRRARLRTKDLIYYFFFPKMLSFMRPAEKILKSVPLGAQYMVVGRKF